MRKKRPAWVRTAASSTVALCHFPKFVARVAEQPKGWQWRLMLGNEGIALGATDSREAAEAAAIARVKELLGEIGAACPR